jgi:C1A family cysteine protease
MSRFNFFTGLIAVLNIQLLHAQSTKLLSVNAEMHQKEKSVDVMTQAKQESSFIPNAFSLEKYLPPIGNQSDVGSCVGWATTYYGLTMIKRMEKGLNTAPFSPWSTFNRYKAKNKENPCYGGARMYECLEILKQQGAPFHSTYAFPYCSKENPKLRYTDKLSDFKELQAQNAQQIKKSLTDGCPVVIGLKIFDGGKGNSLNSHMLDSNGVIKMECFRDTYAAGAHAMCIVGFDDQMDGGAFKLVNSWGEDWGKDGFCWLRYADLKILICAYALFPEKYVKPPNSNAPNRSASGEFRIKNKSNITLLLAYSMNNEHGRITKGWYTLPAQEESVIILSDGLGSSLDIALIDEHRTPMTVNGIESLKVQADIKKTFHYFGEMTSCMESEMAFYRMQYRKNRKLRITNVKNDALDIH